METAAGRAALRERKQLVELVFADAKVRHCLARAQRRGRDNMLIQALLTAAAMDLRKLVQFQPPVGAGAAAMRSLLPFQGAVWVVQCIADWATQCQLSIRRAQVRSVRSPPPEGLGAGLRRQPHRRDLTRTWGSARLCGEAAVR